MRPPSPQRKAPPIRRRARGRSKIAVFSLLIAAACAHSTAAHAESAEDRETARQFLDRGDEQAEKGDLEGALASYKAAHELMHVPTTGLEVARVLVKLGKLVEARDVALEVVRMPANPKESRPFKAARAAAETLARDIAPQIPSLRIELTPEDAPDTSLEIDQRAVPLSAIGLGYSLNPGAHRIRISATGYETASRNVTLRVGETQTLRVELVVDPTPAAAPAAPVRKKPARRAESTSPPPAPPPAPAEESSTTWPQWLGFSLAGAGVVVGTVAGVLSLDRTRAAKEQCTGNKCTPAAQGNLDDAINMANISNIGFGAAALGTVIGVTGILLSGGSSDKTSAKLHVTAAPGVAMLRCEGALW